MPQNPVRYQVLPDGRIIPIVDRPTSGELPPPPEGVNPTSPPMTELLKNPGDPSKSIMMPVLSTGQSKELIDYLLTGGSLLAGLAIPGGPAALVGPSAAGTSMGPALRMGVPTALETVRSGVDSDFNPLEMAKSAFLQALLGSVGEVGGPWIPRAGNAAALTFGGAGKYPTIRQALDAADAVRMSRSQDPIQWFTPRGGNLNIANGPAIQREIELGNKELERAELASPVHLNAEEMMGAGQKIEHRAQYSDRPSTNPQRVAGEDVRFGDELLEKYLGIPQGATYIEVAQTVRGPQLVPAGARVPGSIRVPLTPVVKQWLLKNKINFSAREAGEFKRGLREERVVTARAQKQPISKEDFDRDVINTSRSEQIDATVKAKEAARGQGTPIADANKMLADLNTMKGANESMRGPGVMAPFGQLTARMSLGMATGGTGAYYTGQPVSAGTGLGAIAGILGLSPRALSAFGSIGGRAAQLTPSVVRANQVRLAKDQLDDYDPKKPGVQRRKPSGSK